MGAYLRGVLMGANLRKLSSKSCCLYKTFPNSIQLMGLHWPHWCEQSSLNNRSNAHCDGATMALLCKLVKRGAVQANDLPLSNDLEVWPDSSVGRALTYNARGREFKSRLVRLFFFHFHFSFLPNFIISLPLQYIYIYICA